MSTLYDKEKQFLLLRNFNSRNCDAFGEVYTLYFKELTYFAQHLYRGTEVCAADVIQDIFIKVWQNNKLQFEGLNNIKAYLFICVRNSFRNYLDHRKCVNEYQLKARLEDDAFVVQVAESEIFTHIPEMVKLLPEACAEVFSLFMKGFDATEIAEKLGKDRNTIYSQRRESISILRKKFSPDKIIYIISFFIS